MENYGANIRILNDRLQELRRSVAKIETDLRHPLDADWEEQAIELEDSDTLKQLDDAGRAEMQRIRIALSRIQNHIYDICTDCGEKIGIERLHAVPTTTLCIHCAQKPALP